MDLNKALLVIGLDKNTYKNIHNNQQLIEHMTPSSGVLIAGGSIIGSAWMGPIGGAVGALIGAAIGGEKQPTTLTIDQEIQNFVNSTQQQVVNVITQSIINISHDIVQQQIATITNDTDTKNDLDASEIIVRNGASFSIEQQNNLKTIVQAILNLVQSSELITKLSTLIKNDISSTLSQNSDLANKIAATSALLKAQKNSGELNTAISGIKDVIGGMAELGSTRGDTTIISNKVLNSINLDSSSRADIEDYINNTINITIKQITMNTCIQSNNILNQIYLKQILVDGEGSSFEIIQQNILISFFKCVITSSIKNEDLQNISLDTLNTAALNASQGATVSNDLSATYKKSDISSNSSFLDSSSGTIFAVVLVVIIMFFILIKK